MFSAGPQTSYWLCKWMNEPSYYFKYVPDQRGKVPTGWTDYILEYTSTGRPGDGNAYEHQLLAKEVERICKLGSMVAIIFHQCELTFSTTRCGV
jgi:hypothetical protein